MTATTTTTAIPEQAVPDRGGRAGIGRLTLVELRKMADTRSGKWLLAVVLLIVLVVDVVQFFAFDNSDQTFPNILQAMMLFVGILLPVIGVLLVTSEWSQNTALVTYTLVPGRSRILTAKLLAGLLLTVMAAVAAGILAAIGNIVSKSGADGDGTWHITGSLILGAVIFELANMWMGMAFGAVFMNSPLAIVVYFALPTVWSILGSTISSLNSVDHWLDTSTTLGNLLDDNITGKEWTQVLVSCLVWVLLPLIIGAIRLSRTEVK